MVTQVVNSRNLSWDDERALDSSFVYIGRPSVWGNPYSVGPDGTRAEVISKYREYLEGKPDMLAMVGSLKGKVLVCWCAPQACHGDVLAELAEGISG